MAKEHEPSDQTIPSRSREQTAPKKRETKPNLKQSWKEVERTEPHFYPVMISTKETNVYGIISFPKKDDKSPEIPTLSLPIVKAAEHLAQKHFWRLYNYFAAINKELLSLTEKKGIDEIDAFPTQARDRLKINSDKMGNLRIRSLLLPNRVYAAKGETFMAEVCIDKPQDTWWENVTKKIKRNTEYSEQAMSFAQVLSSQLGWKITPVNGIIQKPR